MKKKIISEYVERFFHLYWKENIYDALFILNHIVYWLYLKSLEDFDVETVAINNSLFAVETSSEKCSWEYIKSLKEDDFLENFEDNIVPFLDVQKVFYYEFSSLVKLSKFRDLKDASLTYELFLLISELFLELEKRLDTKKIPASIYGEIFEELLKRYNQSKMKDGIPVPSHIARLMAELLQPTLSDTLYAPTLGTGELLVAAYQKIIGDGLSDGNSDFDTDGFRFGDIIQTKIDRDRLRMLVLEGNQMIEEKLFLSILNFYFHGINTDMKFTFQNPLAYNSSALTRNYSRVILSPLFPSSTKDIPDIDENLQMQVGKNRPAMYFARSLEKLQPGGRLVALMPDSFLFRQDKAITKFRTSIIEQYNLEGVISLPKGTFAPFANINTSIIVLSKQTPNHNDVWMCELKNDGYSLNSKRQRNAEFPLPSLIDNFKERAELHNGLMDAFLVSKDDIRIHRSAWTVSFFNDYDTLKEKSLEDPLKILSTLKELEGKIQSELKDLSTLLENGKILG